MSHLSEKCYIIRLQLQVPFIGFRGGFQMTFPAPKPLYRGGKIPSPLKNQNKTLYMHYYLYDI